MRFCFLEAETPLQADAWRFVVSVNLCVGCSGVAALAWLIGLRVAMNGLLGLSDCGWYKVRDETRLGKWYDAPSDTFELGYVCEKPAREVFLSTSKDCTFPIRHADNCFFAATQNGWHWKGVFNYNDRTFGCLFSPSDNGVRFNNNTGADGQFTEIPLCYGSPWYYLQNDHGKGVPVQCGNPGHLKCASNNGVSCQWGDYGDGFSSYQEVAGVTANTPLEKECPGWTTSDGTDPCEQLDCYRIIRQSLDFDGRYKIKLSASSSHAGKTAGWSLSAFESSQDARNQNSYTTLVHAPDDKWNSAWVIEDGSASGQYKIKLDESSSNAGKASGWYLNAFGGSSEYSPYIRNNLSYYAVVQAPDEELNSEWIIEDGSVSGQYYIRLAASSNGAGGAAGWYLTAFEDAKDFRNDVSYYAMVYKPNDKFNSEWEFESEAPPSPPPVPYERITNHCEDEFNNNQETLQKGTENNSATNTLDGCAQACLDNPDCKGFQLGTEGRKHEHDCILSKEELCQDNQNWEYYRVIRIRQFYEPLTSGCSESHQTLRRGNEDNDETNTLSGCATACLNTPKCKSFSFGIKGRARANDCLLDRAEYCDSNKNWAFYRIIRSRSLAANSSRDIVQKSTWFFLNVGEGVPVQCGAPNKIKCASDDGLNCKWGTYGRGFADYQELLGVVAKAPLEKPCPGWSSSDGSDACEKLNCYEASYLDPKCMDYCMTSPVSWSKKCKWTSHKCSKCNACNLDLGVRVAPDMRAASCQEGWQMFLGSCYSMVCQPKRHWEAEKTCRQRGTYLASIRSASENDFVQGLCGDSACWLGGMEAAGREDWLWLEGATSALGRPGNWTAYTNWASDQPNNPGGRDDNALLMNGALPRSSGGIDTAFFILMGICKIIVPAGLVVYVFFALRRKDATSAQAVCILLSVLTFSLSLEVFFCVLMFFDSHVVKEVIVFVIFLIILSCAQIALCARASCYAYRVYAEMRSCPPIMHPHVPSYPAGGGNGDVAMVVGMPIRDGATPPGITPAIGTRAGPYTDHTHLKTVD